MAQGCRLSSTEPQYNASTNALYLDSITSKLQICIATVLRHYWIMLARTGAVLRRL